MRRRAVQRLYGALASGYDRRWARYVDQTTARTVAALAPDALRPGARVLDIGCGTGVLLARLLAREPSLRCVGVDLTPQMLTVAADRLGPRVPLVLGSGAALPIADASCDVVVSTSALHYLPDPARLVAEARRVLVPGGQLVVSDWCAEFATMRALGIVLTALNRGHEEVWTTTACVRAFEAAGFIDLRARRDRLGWFWGLMTVGGFVPP
jgi:ubiquinone/menaquinone biosynthesis C-methylase UbiE